jgi:hypothetical protein
MIPLRAITGTWGLSLMTLVVQNRDDPKRSIRSAGMLSSSNDVPESGDSVISTRDFQATVITGLRVEEVEKGVTYDEGASVVLAGTPVRAA